MDLSPKLRALISRAAALVLGIVLVYGGIRVLLISIEAHRDWQQRFENRYSYPQRESSGAAQLLFFALLLLVPGAIITVMALIPTSWLFAIPITPPGTRDNSQPGVPPYGML
jgi:hypothetical protein